MQASLRVTATRRWRARFEIAVAGDLLHQVGQVEPRLYALLRAAIDARQGEQLADQGIQPLHFGADALEVLRGLFDRALLYQPERHPQTRQGRAQLVRDIAEQASLSR